MDKKSVAAIACIAGVASAVVAVLAYFKSSEPTTSVKASGDNSIAAGNDVRIGERTTVDKHDFSEDLKRDAQAYLSVASGSCKDAVAKIEPLTADSAIDMTQMHGFYPPEMYPTQIVAEHFGEQAYRDITAKLEQTLQHFQVAIRPLVANSIRSVTGFAAKPQDKSRDAAAFATDKRAWLESTTDLCRYLDSLGR